MSEPLQRMHRRAERGKKWRSFLLVMPLLAFLAVFFFTPILTTLVYAVSSPEVEKVFPQTLESLQGWDGEALPGEASFATLRRELATGYDDKTVAGVATRLNYEISGYRSLIMRTARRADKLEPPYAQSFVEIDERWSEVDYWRAIRMAAGPLTSLYLLQAIDLERDWTGSISRTSEEQAVYVTYLARTFWISTWVTVACVLIGYPLAYYAANTTSGIGKLVLAAVILPFWISVLVRTASWVVILQREGLINDFLLMLEVIDEPLQLIFNRFGVYVAMIHVLLPFLVLPLYSTMKAISPTYMKAAESLGARPIPAFFTVYLPQTLPGLSAGVLLVFVLTLGYYITPTLVGGPNDQMLSFLVTQFALKLGNWGMAGASAVLLLVCTLLAYAIIRKVLGARGNTGF
nr:ABC transporter permease [uncultured Roseovarius sp.]